MKFPKWGEDWKNPFFIFLLIFTIYTLTPLYDKENGIYNFLISDYKLTWHDGRSPANLVLIESLIRNFSITLPNNTSVGNVPISNHFDFTRLSNDKYFPLFFGFHHFIFLPLSIFQPSEVDLFKILILTNSLLLSLLPTIFYFYQIKLGLREKYAFLSSIAFGLCSSLFVYSKYLFLRNTFFPFFLLLSLYFLEDAPDRKKELISAIFLFLAASCYIPLLYQLIIFWALILPVIFKCKKVRKRIFLIAACTSLLTSTIINFSFETEGRQRLVGNILFSIFPTYIPAWEYKAYGYHDPSSIWKLERESSYIYGFKEGKGNALFLFSYQPFETLFGPRGFFFNSPFLIFSIPGIVISWKRKKYKLLLWTSILLFAEFSLYPTWKQGAAPRYVRGFEVPIATCTFFSFLFLQNKRKRILWIPFSLLLTLSFLNTLCLAIRTDWVYENEVDLVSYDLCLWPFCPWQEKELTLILTSKIEQMKWVGNGTMDCLPDFSWKGILTDPCYCTARSWATREVVLYAEFQKLKVKACAEAAGGDGTEGFIKIGDFEAKLFIPPNSCVERSFNFTFKPGLYTITLTSGKYKKCNAEWVIWKRIEFS